MELADVSSEPPSNILNILTTTTSVLGMPDWATWIIIVLLVMISFICTASETSFLMCNKYHFKVLADDGKLYAKVIVFLTERYDNTLVSVLIGNNLVQTLISFICTILFLNILPPEMENYITIINSVVVGFTLYVLGDTLPKILSKSIPNRMAVIIAFPDIVLYFILWPFMFLFQQILKLFKKIFHIKDSYTLTKEEFIDQVDDAISEENILNEKEQLFEQNEINIIKKAFNFDQIKVAQIYTPIEKIISINIDDLNVDYVNDFLMKNTYSRYPIYEDEKDNFVGILNIKSYFKEYAIDRHLDIRSVLSQPLFVYEDEFVDNVFKEFNIEKSHIAIVKNRDEKVIGMITMEDILGQLIDENDYDDLEVND